jgi:hypothetical protein
MVSTWRRRRGAFRRGGAPLSDELAGVKLPETGQPYYPHRSSGPHSWGRKGISFNLDRIRVTDECRCGAVRYSCYAFRLGPLCVGQKDYERVNGELVGAWGPVGRWTSTFSDATSGTARREDPT